MSLRSRLLLVTVILVAFGLAGASVATYSLVSRAQIARIDDQLQGARLFATGGVFEGGPLPSFRPAPEPGSSLPVTYGALLDARGDVVAVRSFGFGIIASPPELPPSLPGSATFEGRDTSVIFTADAADGSLRYRVLAAALPRLQGTVVVGFPLTEVDATLRRLVLVEGLVGALVLGATAALALWLVRLGLRPLEEMENAATEIAAGNLSRRVAPDDERTEVGRLGRALNEMLAQIEAAFDARRASEDRLRRFVADASHELRTPLTSIRGYAELFRRGADQDAEDLATSMRRIEEESSRMGDLVDELLLLARLDEGRPLARAPVDLSDVVRDAVEDARAAHSASIDFEQGVGVIVEGDEARLRQVAANLLSNAVVHTPPGTPVRARVTTDGETAVLEVADDGPGLEPEVAEKVFDRFFRADPARSRATGSVGLGLAIVAAIVHAHGGAVSVESEPGSGARFVVRLPLAAADVGTDAPA